MWAAQKTYVSVLVEHANDAVGEVEDVPPVEVGHVGLAVLRRAAVQEVEDVPGGERRLLQGPVDEIHHGRVADGVLIAIERNAGRGRKKREKKQHILTLWDGVYLWKAKKMTFNTK